MSSDVALDVPVRALRALATQMDDAYDLLFADPSPDAVVAFVHALNSACTGDAAHAQCVMRSVRAHPLFHLMLEDPYTARAFNKPRGYAGDAVMLDYVYDAVPPANTSAIGQSVFAVTTGLENALSVIHRRDALAELIDDVASCVAKPRVLSIACGHLREARLSDAVRCRKLQSFHAVDQDPLSLAVVEAELSELDVTAVPGSVSALLRGALQLPRMDLIYAAGLLDYLTAPVAARLIATLSQMLAPGGILLVANFVPHTFGQPYMEAVMDWHLVLRTADELHALVEPVPGAVLQREPAPLDPHGNIAYLQLRRSG